MIFTVIFHKSPSINDFFGLTINFIFDSMFKPIGLTDNFRSGGETEGQIGHIFRFPEQDFHPVVDLELLTGLYGGFGSSLALQSSRLGFLH